MEISFYRGSIFMSAPGGSGTVPRLPGLYSQGVGLFDNAGQRIHLPLFQGLFEGLFA